jgi:heterotetrameric sarcosine oxidase gamma subunit
MGLATSSAIALGPGDWLILSPETDREIALAKIAASQGYAVELSDALVMLELDDAATTLSELTGINAETFGSGRSARTKLAGIGVILTTAANGNVRMIFDVSYARHVRKFLECAI